MQSYSSQQGAAEIAPTPAFEFHQISAGYQGRRVLDNVSLSARPRERIAVLGPNGAGKSTLFRVGAGLIRPHEGSVRLEGIAVTEWTPDRRAIAGIGFMLQGGRVFPSLSVKENLVLSASRGRSANKDLAVERVTDALPALRDKWLKPSALLSGGERHVLALGMVLAREPTVLLLDEPSAGLAPGLGIELLERIFALADQFTITLMVIEHRMDVLRLASRALLLGSGGVLCETIQPESWLHDGTLESAVFDGIGFDDGGGKPIEVASSGEAEHASR